jgi:two-component system chemotaxis response regulator CheB
MPGKGRNIVVIGTSAGGLDALDTLIGQWPDGLPAALLMVQHISPENTGEALLSRLCRHRAFVCGFARDRERIAPRHLYLAPADHHLLVKDGVLSLTRGARENRFRPAVDVLFRSAAVAHGTRVIGVVLTGMLDDGTAGLLAIKRCGGVTVVQDPKDAAYPGMPENALNNLDVDYCVPLAGMGRLLEELVREPPGRARPIPQDVRAEAEIAERVVGGIGKVEALGARTPYSCPACGGGLWEVDQPGPPRFRCHTGHSYTAASLLAGQSEKVEESLWVSLRLLEERRNLMLNMARKEKSRRSKKYYADRAEEADVHAGRVRHLLLAPRAD